MAVRAFSLLYGWIWPTLRRFFLFTPSAHAHKTSSNQSQLDVRDKTPQRFYTVKDIAYTSVHGMIGLASFVTSCGQNVHQNYNDIRFFYSIHLIVVRYVAIMKLNNRLVYACLPTTSSISLIYQWAGIQSVHVFIKYTRGWQLFALLVDCVEHLAGCVISLNSSPY